MGDVPDFSGDLGPVEGFARRAEHEIADRMRELMRFGYHDAPQPAAAPAVPHNDNQEVTPMSVVAEGIDLFRQGLAKFENLDHEALDKLEAIQSNPATSEAFDVIAALTHLPPASLATGTAVLKMILQAAGGQPAPASIAGDAQPQDVPAGPVIGGQA